MRLTATKTLSPKQFTAKAERGFRAANPDAVDLAFDWTWISRPCPNKGGPGKFRTARATVTATGYRTRTIWASAAVDGSGMIVR